MAPQPLAGVNQSPMPGGIALGFAILYATGQLAASL